MNSPGAQIAAFVGALFDPVQFVEIRRLPSGRSTWHLARDIQQIIDACIVSNRAGQDIYIGVNPRPGLGANGNACIRTARCVFADFDPKHLTTSEPDDQVREVMQRIRDRGMPEPSIVLHSGHGVHVYWLADRDTNDLGRWVLIMDALITSLGSDTVCKNEERIMRVPGLLNYKPPVATSQLIFCDPTRRESWDELALCVFHANLPEPIDVSSRGIDDLLVQHTKATAQRSGVSVIATFNREVDLRDLLERFDYDIVGSHFRRPGKEGRGFSGIIRQNKDDLEVSVHFSSNDALNDQKFGRQECGIHDAFSVYLNLVHNGDLNAAIKAAARLLGIELPKQKRDAEIILEIRASEDADTFTNLIQKGASSDQLIALLQRHTTNPRQIERIVQRVRQRHAEIPA